MTNRPHSPYGWKRSNDVPTDGSDFGGNWVALGDQQGRFESAPPEGVELSRAERRALALVEYTRQQAETRSYGGSRIWGGCGCKACRANRTAEIPLAA